MAGRPKGSGNKSKEVKLKRNKIETININEDMTEQGINYCSMQLSDKCKKLHGFRDVGDFYSSGKQTFYSNGRFTICKDCLKEFCYKDGEINLPNFKSILRIYDLPFFIKEWESSVDDKNETIGVYMKNIFLNYKDKGYSDGDIDDSTLSNNIKNCITHDEELEDRWGNGWTQKELRWLDQDYTEWLTHHDGSKMSVQRLMQMICIKELEIRNARQDGKPTDKLEKSLRELMSDASLTPKTMSAINETDSEKVFGTWLKEIQEYRPTEYFEDKTLYEDYDGIGEYFERFVLRPMKNLLTGTRDFDKEFNVEDSGDNNV